MSILTLETWQATLPPERRPLFDRLRALVREHDPNVREAVELYGSGKPFLVFQQDDEVKYALGDQKHYVSFYSMLAYCYLDLHAQYLVALGRIKMQKSCINIPPKADFPYDAFAEVLRAGAALPYPTPLQLAKRKSQKK